jgi:RNA-binding protein
MDVDLTESQKRHLRGLAHPLKPIVSVGNAGVTTGLTEELERCLDDHELIKVKVRVGERTAREAAIQELVHRSGATLIRRVGNIAILYRRREHEPEIKLPGWPESG